MAARFGDADGACGGATPGFTSAKVAFDIIDRSRGLTFVGAIGRVREAGA